jgi:hypothetical protein
MRRLPTSLAFGLHIMMMRHEAFVYIDLQRCIFPANGKFKCWHWTTVRQYQPFICTLKWSSVLGNLTGCGTGNGRLIPISLWILTALFCGYREPHIARTARPTAQMPLANSGIQSRGSTSGRRFKCTSVAQLLTCRNFYIFWKRKFGTQRLRFWRRWLSLFEFVPGDA